MKKIAFYCCSNGYGHFHRTLQIVKYLKNLDVSIYCNEYQYKKFSNKLPVAKYIFYEKYNIRWDDVIKNNHFDYKTYVKNVQGSVKDIDKYDLVITDNLVEILKYRSDAIYSGSFLWFDVFQEKFGDNEFTINEKELFYKHEPLVVCNDEVSLRSLKSYENKLDIGWGCDDMSTEDYQPNNFCFIVPSLNYTSNYLEKFLEIREQFKNKYNMSFNINNKHNSVFIVRPGLGIINTCVSYKIPMICLYSDEDSFEIKCLSKKVEKLGFGISLNVNENLKRKKLDFQKMRSKYVQEMGGYKKFARFINNV